MNKSGFWKTVREKLSSRKLWAAVLSMGISLTAVFFGELLTAEMVDALECAAAAAVAYIFGEGAVDAARQLHK